MTPVILQAQAQCTNPSDTQEVWGKLARMADDEVPPLLAATPEGLKYQSDGKSEHLTKDALRKRLKRQM